MADRRQVRLIIDLFNRRGYPVQRVDMRHRGLGAEDPAMGMQVDDWLDGLDQRTTSRMIDMLITGECGSTP